MEHLQYDQHGQLLTASLMDYLLPSAADFPNIRGKFLELALAPGNPFGAKGAGEGGIVAVAAAIANAVSAALSSFGVQVRSLPLSPRVWGLIRESYRGAHRELRQEIRFTCHLMEHNTRSTKACRNPRVARANISNIRLKSEQWFVRPNGAILNPPCNQPNVSVRSYRQPSPTSAPIHLDDLTRHVAGGI
jgi:hypothetical protein